MGIRLHDGDYVIGASVALPDSQLLTVTENGYGNSTPLDEYRVQSRGGRDSLIVLPRKQANLPV